VFLRGDEALQHDPDGRVDIVVVHVVAEVHSRVRERHAYHGLDVPHANLHAARARLLAQLRVQL
jgi:hypothetical protein